MSDSSTWPKLSTANLMAWGRWKNEEPDTLEKWRYIVEESKRDGAEFAALMDRRRVERLAALPIRETSQPGAQPSKACPKGSL